MRREQSESKLLRKVLMLTMEGDEKEEWERFWKSRSLNLLRYSCRHGTVDVVKFFVSSGVDPTAERSVYVRVHI